ncbi:unnamed protein product [Spirodela intermedia]|uniref:Uncharacterized protein n=1 Tax=Spirodela intermedia TaxID=51605 RepID=A0A7I8JDG1_SPIIN|nr:unnamed protein product [Spirodela intermedia]CAA6668190.1 unnamed protein product [Spirodela intermedia]
MAASILSLFPDGFGIMVIDDNEQSLHDVVQGLESYGYTVTPCSRVTSALDILIKDERRFDLILTEARMVDMDAFALLHQVEVTFDIPVIMMSAGGGLGLAGECIKAGASFYLQKPLDYAAVSTIWQHVAVKKMRVFPIDATRRMENRGSSPSFSVSGEERRGTGESPDNVKRRDVEDDDDHEGDEEVERGMNGTAVTEKKERVEWTNELHLLFLDAVDKLGINRAAPRKILKLMGRRDLTRTNVASHLQKYRQHLAKITNSRNRPEGNRSRRRFFLTKRRSVFECGPQHLTEIHRLEMESLNQSFATDAQRSADNSIKPQVASMKHTNIPKALPIPASAAEEMRHSRQDCDSTAENFQAFAVEYTVGLRACVAAGTSALKFPGSNTIATSDVSEPQNSGCGNNYIGLELQTASEKLGLTLGTSPGPKVIAPVEGESKDEIIEDMILDQLLQEEAVSSEKRTNIHKDLLSSGFGKNDPTIQTSGNHFSPLNQPSAELLENEDLSIDEFLDTQLDSLSQDIGDISQEAIMSLLFDDLLLKLQDEDANTVEEADLFSASQEDRRQ